jgi:glycylpeptide N-tetradecanoyltransferase
MNKKNIFLDSINKESRFFPFEIKWRNIKIDNISQIHAIFSFLESNYIEDHTSTFRFNYIHEFINFVIKIPKSHSIFNIGMHFKRGKKLVGLITSIPKLIVFDNFMINSSEINFLCIEKKIRSTRLVSILIEEVTRKLNLTGTIQALFTTAISFLESFLVSRYYHYPINFLKLYQNNFLKTKMHFNKTDRFYKKNKRFKQIGRTNINAYEIYRRNLPKLRVYSCFMGNDFFHWFKTVEGIFYVLFLSFKKKKKVKFTAVYSLPNKSIRKNKKMYIYCSYSYFSFMKINLKIVSKNIIKILESLGFDIFNILASENEKTKMNEIGYRKGTGLLFFHLFNWNAKKILAKENGLITF